MGLVRFFAAVAAALLSLPVAASAHPLGNFTVNHLARVLPAPHELTVRYVLDLAEIPTFALERSLDAHAHPTQAVLRRWAAGHLEEIAPRLVLRVDDAPVRLAVAGAADVRLRPGAGGLPTLRLAAQFAAPLAAGGHRITFADESEPGRVGWKDVVAGNVAEPTDELRRYPPALAGSPRARTSLSARLDGHGRIVDAGAAPSRDASQPPAAVASALRANALSDILARGSSSPALVFAAIVLAIALGALHALEPGHGKTLLAVSLVGARATPRQAFVLAGALTVAHTAGVLALGALVLAAAAWIVPERVYPWVTLGSGVLVTILGARAVAHEVRRRLPRAHAHRHEHDRAHPHEHVHVHAAAAHHHHDGDDLEHARAHAIPGAAPLTFRSAVFAAASGNVAPCPAAFVVLLTAMQLHRVGYGLALIVAFGIGLAATLTILGVAVVRGAAWLVARPHFAAAARWSPLVTAGVVAAIGAAMVGQGLAANGGGVSAPLVAALVLFAIAGYAVAWHAPRTARGAHA